MHTDKHAYLDRPSESFQHTRPQSSSKKDDLSTSSFKKDNLSCLQNIIN